LQECAVILKNHNLVLLAALMLCFSINQADAFSICSNEPQLDHTTHELITACTVELTEPESHWEQKAGIHFARAELYDFIGDFDHAITDYTAAINIMKDNPAAYERRGDAYATKGMPDKAQADYDEAQKHGAIHAGDFDYICWSRAIRGRLLDRALADCDAAVKEDPNSKYEPAYLDSRCLVYFRMGNDAAAIADCDVAVKLMEHLSWWQKRAHAGSFYIRGLAKIRSGDVEGGNADIAAAKKLEERVDEQYALYGIQPTTKPQ
jgi:tetratricopeptide (TPR) repeat protein